MSREIDVDSTLENMKELNTAELILERKGWQELFSATIAEENKLHSITADRENIVRILCGIDSLLGK